VRRRTAAAGTLPHAVRHSNLVLKKETAMTLSLGPLISLVAGVLILITPRLLNYIVAAYLIIVGLLGLFGDVRIR
jgi:hypothetical protein